MTKSKIFILSLLFFSSILNAQTCIDSSAYNNMLSNLLSHSVPEICADSAASLDSSTVFLDAREFNETKISTIANAIPIGYDHFRIKLIKSIPKNTQIVVYCSVGYRSEKITEKLIKAGYINVSNLYGGIFEWVNQGFPIYTQVQKQNTLTTKVHAYNRSWGKWLYKGEKVYNH